MAILFISCLVPDREQYWTPAFTRSANNAVMGIAEGLKKFANESVELLSHPLSPPYPHGKLWIPRSIDKLDNGMDIVFMPTINLTIVKSLCWAIYVKKYIKQWAKRHRGESLKVLEYNPFHPSISVVFKECRHVGARLYSILYDLGVPPKHQGFGWIKQYSYTRADVVARKYIPLIDGRIIINEKIIDSYAPTKDYILIDGGINKHVINSLFPLVANQGKIFKLVCAGLLWEQNGTRLIIDMLKKYPNLNVEIIFAGKGQDVDMIKETAQCDSRVKYVGMLDMKSLFKLYQESDVLLNIRLEEAVDFHFPSKLLEYLVTGKHVISTPVAHAERDYGQYLTVLKDKTVDGLADAIKRVEIMGKEELLNIGAKARSFMIENRSWDAQTKRIIKYMNK